MDNQRVRIFDTTLRDGEQSPGVALTVQEKVRIAHQLQKLSVDIIEAGFPISSSGDFDAVRQIATEIESCSIAALARCEERDVEAALAALEPARSARVHVFIATSDVHMKAKLNLTQQEVLKRVEASVKKARRHCNDVEFSAEDATRSDPEFLVEVAMAAYQAGARTLNFPDTVGYAMSDEYGRLIGFLHEALPSDAVISVHCHDDLGLAVANSLAGVRAGARQVEVAVNGIGERAGNAALEEVAVALTARADHWGLAHGLALSEIYRTSQLVSQCTGMLVQANKAIVGDNAFRHESGIHQDGMLKDPKTYEFLDAGALGQGSHLIIGKHSGRHALRDRLERMGISYTADDLHIMQRRIKSLAEGKQTINDGELMTLWHEMKTSAGESHGA